MKNRIWQAWECRILERVYRGAAAGIYYRALREIWGDES